MTFKTSDGLGYRIAQIFERFDLRRWINNNPRIIIGITLGSLFVFILIAISVFASTKQPQIKDYSEGWFYDLNTSKLFTASKDLQGPIEAPSGLLENGQPAGVKAYVFTYVREPNESERFIGFLEMPDPNYNIQQNSSSTNTAQQWGRGKLIRTIEDANWVCVNSHKGKTIMREISLPNQQGQTPIYYPPKEKNNIN